MSNAGTSPPNTLFIGAPTRLGHALNDLVRANGARFRAGGVAAYPNKMVTHALRASIGDDADASALEALLSSAPSSQMFLSGLYALGRPGTALRDDELFPEAERMLGGIANVLAGRFGRVILAIEPVHHLLLSVGRDDVFSRTRSARWEALYEVSWADLVSVVVACFPDAEIVVLTPYSARDGAAPILHRLFGSIGFEMAGDSAGVTFESAATNGTQISEIKEKTGLDHVACDLLLQRFDQDVEAVAAQSKARVF